MNAELRIMRSPVRCWVLSGNGKAGKCVNKAQKSLNVWKLGHVIWTMVPGMNIQTYIRGRQYG